MQGVNHQNMNETNKFLLLKAISTHGPISRIALSRQTKLSKMTITSLIGDYIDKGIVRECGICESSAGRKPTLLEVVADSLLTLGICVGRDFLQVGIVDLKGRIISSDQIQMAQITSEETFMKSLFAICDRIFENVDRSKVWGIGISSIGPININEGIILNPPNFNIGNINIVSSLQEKYHLPVFIENDMAVSALAEMYFGGGRGYDHFIYLGVTAGVGSGIIINSRLYSGTTGLAGSLGHMIIESDGEPCACGQRGCIEAYSSIRATVNWVKKNGADQTITWLDLLNKASFNDELCVKALDRMCSYLTIALINAINLYDPQCVLVGGEFWFGANLVIDKLSDMVNERIFAAKVRKSIPIMRSHFPGNASFIGTAALVMENNLEYRKK
ncbi:ROK family protein [Oscillospiraceae bacterium PP1C4]